MSRSGVLLAAAWPVGAVSITLLEPSQYVIHILVIAGIYMILALSLNLIFGFAGLLSLGTPAFFGVGAYATALLTIQFGWDFLAVLAAAAALSFLAAVLIGIPSLRLSRHSFVIVTLSFTLLLQLVASSWTDLTRGALGLPNIPAPVVLGHRWSDKATWLYVVVFADVAVFAMFLRIVRSRFGRALVATRDNEALARAVGFATFRIKLFAFAISGMFAGVAGAFFAHYITFIDPGVFDFTVTENLLVMVIVGGSGTLLGPPWGAVIFTVVPELLRISPEIRSLVYGIVLLAAVLAFPGGLARLRGSASRGTARIRRP